MSQDNNIDDGIYIIKRVVIGFCVFFAILFLWPVLLNPIIWGAIFFIKWAIKKLSQ